MRRRYRLLAAAGFAVFASAAPMQSQGTGETEARAAVEKMVAAFKAADALHVKVVWVARYTGGADADEGERAGDVPVRHLWRRPALLGQAPAAPGEEPDRSGQSKEKRAGERKNEISRQRRCEPGEGREGGQRRRRKNDRRAQRPRISPANAALRRVGDRHGCPLRGSGTGGLHRQRRCLVTGPFLLV